MAEFKKILSLKCSKFDYYRRVADDAIFVCKMGGTYQMADKHVDFSRPLFVATDGLYVPILGESLRLSETDISRASGIVEPTRAAKEFLPIWKSWGGTITMPIQLRELVEAITAFKAG